MGRAAVGDNFPAANTLIACESSGVVREAMNTKPGIKAVSCDFLPPDDGSAKHIQGDCLPVIRSRHWLFVGLHYTCTFFTNSGVRWLYVGGRGTVPDMTRRALVGHAADELARLWQALVVHSERGYFENPVMHGFAATEIASRVYGWVKKPAQIIQPWMFGVWETKATGLWLHNLPPLVPTYRTKEACRIALGLSEYVTVKGVLVKNKPLAKVHLASPGPNRWKERSKTLPEYGAAMAEQWGGLVK
jgi:hypothetical protein